MTTMRAAHALLLTLFACALGCAGNETARKAIQQLPPKPTIVIVHGAWGGGWSFKETATILSSRGYTVYRPTLTGLGERVHLSSREICLSTHIEDVVNTILFEDLHDIVLVGHSYGGMVVTGVADRIPDRIGQMIYLDAFVPENGESVGKLWGSFASGSERLLTTTQPSAFDFIPPMWVEADAPLPHDVPQPTRTFVEPIKMDHSERVRAIPTSHILTVDPGQPPERDTFYKSHQRIKSRGGTAIIMEADHNAHRSKPRELVVHLQRLIER